MLEFDLPPAISSLPATIAQPCLYQIRNSSVSPPLTSYPNSEAYFTNKWCSSEYCSGARGGQYIAMPILTVTSLDKAEIEIPSAKNYGFADY
jgi:hypothetical protein